MSTEAHDELVRRAVKWLRSPFHGILPNGPRHERPGLGVVVPELVSSVGEQPDAMGWGAEGRSYMVECKTSRSDFLADRVKPHRVLGGVGALRFYLCPPDVIREEDLPDSWGLLWCYPKKIRVIRWPKDNPERNWRDEMALMYSLLRRVEVRGQLQRCLSPKWGGDYPKVLEEG